MLVIKSSSSASPGAFRRFVSPDDIAFGSLVETLAKLHYADHSASMQFSISYKDEDKDQVAVSSDPELREAIRLARLSGNAAAGSSTPEATTLKLFVKELQDTSASEDTISDGRYFGCSSGEFLKCFRAFAELFNEFPEAQQTCHKFISAILPLLEGAIDSKKGSGTSLEQSGPLLLSMLRRFDQRESVQGSRDHESSKAEPSPPGPVTPELSKPEEVEEEHIVSEVHCADDDSLCSSQGISSSVIAAFMEEPVPAFEAPQTESLEHNARDVLMSESMADWEVLADPKSSVASSSSSEAPAVASPETSEVGRDQHAAVEVTDVGRCSMVSSVVSTDNKVMRFKSEMLHKLIRQGKLGGAIKYLQLFTRPDANRATLSMFAELQAQIALEPYLTPASEELQSSRERLLCALAELQPKAGLSDFSADIFASMTNLPASVCSSRHVPSGETTSSSAPSSSTEPALELPHVLAVAEEGADAEDKMTVAEAVALLVDAVASPEASVEAASGNAVEVSPEAAAGVLPLEADLAPEAFPEAAVEASAEAAVEASPAAAVEASPEAVIEPSSEAAVDRPHEPAVVSSGEAEVAAPHEAAAEASVAVVTSAEPPAAAAAACATSPNEAVVSGAAPSATDGASVVTQAGPAVRPSSSGSFGRKALYSSFLRDVTLDDGCHVPAGIPVTKSWLVKNTGQRSWIPGDVSLACIDGAEDFGVNKGFQMPLDTVVLPEQQHEVKVEVVPSASPSSPMPRRIRSTWQLTSKSEKCRFGHKLWVDIIATPAPAAPAASTSAYIAVPAVANATTDSVTTTTAASRLDDCEPVLFPNRPRDRKLRNIRASYIVAPSVVLPSRDPAAPEPDAAVRVPPPELEVPAVAASAPAQEPEVPAVAAPEPDVLVAAPEPEVPAAAAPAPAHAPEAQPPSQHDVDFDAILEKLNYLAEIGFTNTERNMQLLLDVEGNLDTALDVLCSAL